MNLKLARGTKLDYIPAILIVAIWTTYTFTRLNNILVAALGVYMIVMGWPYTKFNFRRDYILLLLPALFAAYLVGFLWSDDVREGWHQLEKRLGFLAFPLIFYFGRGVLKREDTTRMLYAFIVACLLISLVCYAYAAWNVMQNHSFKVVGRNERAYYYFSYLPFTESAGIDPIYLSLYADVCFIILLFRPAAKRWVNVLLIIYFFVFNILVASKGGILIGGVVFLLYIITSAKSKPVAIAICAAIVVLSTIVIYKSEFLRTRFVVTTTFHYDHAWAGYWNSTSQRLAIWTCAIETIDNNFPWGNGTGDGEPELYKTYRKNNYIRGYEDGLNPHNEFLFTWLDLGIFGTVVLLLVIGIPLYLSLRMKEKIYLYTIISVAMFFLFEVVLTRRLGVNFLSFFYGLMAVDYFNFITKEQDTNV